MARDSYTVPCGNGYNWAFIGRLLGHNEWLLVHALSVWMSTYRRRPLRAGRVGRSLGLVVHGNSAPCYHGIDFVSHDASVQNDQGALRPSWPIHVWLGLELGANAFVENRAQRKQLAHQRER